MKERYIYIGIYVLLGGFVLWSIYYLFIRGSKKADPDRMLELKDPYMEGPSVCKLQTKIEEKLRAEGKDPAEYLIFDCIFGPSTQEALEEAYGVKKARLRDLE